MASPDRNNLTKTVNDEVLEFLRSYIAGGVNQDFKLWARELYGKLYGSTAEPGADEALVRGVVFDRTGWVCSVCHGWNSSSDAMCVHQHLNRNGDA